MSYNQFCKYLRNLAIVFVAGIAATACASPDEELIPLVLPLVSAHPGDDSCPEKAAGGETDRSAALETNVESILRLAFTDRNGGVDALPFRIEGENGRLIYQGLTDNLGTATARIQFEDVTDFLVIRVVTAAESYSFPITAPRFAENRYDFQLNTEYAPAPDSDLDGMPTVFDYDDNQELVASRLEYQSYQMAFEDLWPAKGDYDFNDVVLKLDFREMQNARAEIREIEIDVRQLASGAGYDHRVCLKLPAGASVNGAPVNPDCLELIASTRAAGVRNTNPAESYRAAPERSLRLVFDRPVSREELGHAPYDLFIFVKNTGHEIHRPGMRFDANGRDLYLAADDGSPWTTIYPYAEGGTPAGWPVEGRTMFQAFPEFGAWLESDGLSSRGWYRLPNACYAMSENGYAGGSHCE